MQCVGRGADRLPVSADHKHPRSARQSQTASRVPGQRERTTVRRPFRHLCSWAATVALATLPCPAGTAGRTTAGVGWPSRNRGGADGAGGGAGQVGAGGGSCSVSSAVCAGGFSVVFLASISRRISSRMRVRIWGRHRSATGPRACRNSDRHGYLRPARLRRRACRCPDTPGTTRAPRRRCASGFPASRQRRSRHNQYNDNDDGGSHLLGSSLSRIGFPGRPRSRARRVHSRKTYQCRSGD
jgi:hypothetical protein